MSEAEPSTKVIGLVVEDERNFAVCGIALSGPSEPEQSLLRLGHERRAQMLHMLKCVRSM